VVSWIRERERERGMQIWCLYENVQPEENLIFCYLHYLIFKVRLGAWKTKRNIYRILRNSVETDVLWQGWPTSTHWRALIIRRDSPDGPNYAHIHRKGEIDLSRKPLFTNTTLYLLFINVTILRPVDMLCLLNSITEIIQLKEVKVPRGFQEVKAPRFRDNGTGW
jgi:hypothetical protein